MASPPFALEQLFSLDVDAFFEDDLRRELCIAPSLMKRINAIADELKIADIPKDLQLLPDDMMGWLEEEKENALVVPIAKKAKTVW